MKFKYHKSYRGYYLLEDNKFKRPYQKLDQEKTLKNLNGEFGFDKNQILEIEESAVVFVEKDGDNYLVLFRKTQLMENVIYCLC